jgi:hypothetical protein
MEKQLWALKGRVVCTSCRDNLIQLLDLDVDHDRFYRYNHSKPKQCDRCHVYVSQEKNVGTPLDLMNPLYAEV